MDVTECMMLLQVNEKAVSVDVKREMQKPQYEGSPKPQRQQKVSSNTTPS